MEVTFNNYARIKKSGMSDEQLDYIRHALTIQPDKFSLIGNEEDCPPIELYTENSVEINVARAFYEVKLKQENDIVHDETSFDLPMEDFPIFKGTLRTDQAKALEAIKKLKEDGFHGGILNAPVGSGKTVFSLAAIAYFRQPTIIIVHKDFLLKQWKERIEQYLPGARIGLIKRDSCDIEDKHIVMASVQTLTAKTRNFPKTVFAKFKVLCADEVHRLGSGLWNQCLSKFSDHFRLGVTATLRRKDKCENVILYQIGHVFYDAKTIMLKPNIKRIYTSFKMFGSYQSTGSPKERPFLIKCLLSNTSRNNLIVSKIIEAVEKGRNPIIVSERVNHLEKLLVLFQKAWHDKYGEIYSDASLYVGKMKEEEKEEAQKKKVLFATVQLIAEGFDVPRLDTLFLTVPLSDVEQCVGRILRSFPDKKDPIVVDFIDSNIPMFMNAAEKRNIIYERMKNLKASTDA